MDAAGVVFIALTLLATDAKVSGTDAPNPLTFPEIGRALAPTDSLTLAEALDAPSLIWNTGGNAAWVAETTLTHDNQDASQSGQIIHLQATWMETTVTGPGALSFWWKVSSESFGDFLDFRIDNGVQTAISGEVGWTQWSNSIPAGTHTLRWQYSKDEDDISPTGSDAGWVDTVTYKRDGSPPNITEQPISRVVPIGIDTTFSVTATGTAPLDYQWRFNGTDIAGATNSCYTINSAAQVDQGDYTVVITNFLDSVTSDVASLSVVIPPTIIIQPQSQVITWRTSVAFSVVASGTAPLSYQWQWNGTNIAGATNDTFSISNTLASQAGSYQAVVTDRGISVTSLVAYLTVLVPPEITTQPQVYVVAPLPGGGDQFIRPSVVMAGTNAIIKASASGTLPLFYQWRFNGTDIDGATDSNFSLQSVSTNQTGMYQVVVSNIVGSATSAIVALIIRAPMRFLINAEAPALTNGAFRLRVVDIPPPPAILVIEASTDLINWLGIYTNFFPATSQKFVDFDASSRVQRFYRAVGRDRLFRFALAAKGQIDLNGSNLQTDSFDSLDPAHSNGGKYDSTKAKANGDVAAYLGITNSLDVGNVDIHGSVATGPGGSVRIGNGGSVSGTITDDMNVAFPDATVPFSNGGYVTAPDSNSGGTLTFNRGNYKLASLSLSGHGRVQINGDVSIWLPGGFSMSGQAEFDIAAGARLQIYTEAPSSISGNGFITQGDASRCIILGLPGCTSLSFGGNAAFTGCVYAPNADFNATGGGNNSYDFIGAAIAKTVTLGGYLNFHYDENLQRIDPMR